MGMSGRTKHRVCSTLPEGCLIASSCRAALEWAFFCACCCDCSLVVLLTVPADSLSLLEALPAAVDARLGGEWGPSTPGMTGEGSRQTGDGVGDVNSGRTRMGSGSRRRKGSAAERGT